MVLPRLAVFAILVHSVPLFVMRLFQKSYDAYTHLFFADFYRGPWVDSFNTRWYGGFDQFSYLPLSHQFLSWFIDGFGYIGAYAIAQCMVLILFSFAVYRYAYIYSDEQGAYTAAWLSLIATSVSQMLYQYGQFPTLFALAFVLLASRAFYDYLLYERKLDLWGSCVLFLSMACSHHMTTCAGALFLSAPALLYAYDRVRLAGIPTAVYGRRFLILSLLLIAGTSLFISPFLIYLWKDHVAQTVIAHASRENYLSNLSIFVNFFWIPIGTSVLLWPQVCSLFKGRLAMKLTGLLWGLLLVLSLGGTTPLAYWIFGPAARTLTFDRFALWHSILTLCLASGFFSRHSSSALKKAFLIISLITYALSIGAIALTKFQPDAIDMRPLKQYLDVDTTDPYRYLTLGFGSQATYLSVLSKRPTIDGNYNFGRRLPVLATSGIEMLDGAKYHGAKGLTTLEEVLSQAKNYSLKVILCNDAFYEPMLLGNGFEAQPEPLGVVRLWTLRNYQASSLTQPVPRTHHSKILYLLWRSYPCLLIFCALYAFFRLRKKTRLGCESHETECCQR